MPIRAEVMRQCEVLIAGTTRQLFRQSEDGIHTGYARGFVGEVARRLNLKATSLVNREECLKGVMLCFVREAQLYKMSTSLYTEFGFMFEVIEEHLKGNKWHSKEVRTKEGIRDKNGKAEE